MYVAAGRVQGYYKYTNGRKQIIMCASGVAETYLEKPF